MKKTLTPLQGLEAMKAIQKTLANSRRSGGFGDLEQPHVEADDVLVEMLRHFTTLQRLDQVDKCSGGIGMNKAINRTLAIYNKLDKWYASEET